MIQCSPDSPDRRVERVPGRRARAGTVSARPWAAPGSTSTRSPKTPSRAAGSTYSAPGPRGRCGQAETALSVYLLQRIRLAPGGKQHKYRHSTDRNRDRPTSMTVRRLTPMSSRWPRLKRQLTGQKWYSGWPFGAVAPQAHMQLSDLQSSAFLPYGAGEQHRRSQQWQFKSI